MFKLYNCHCVRSVIRPLTHALDSAQFYFMFIVIFGALVMPTLLVAVITAATDESTHRVAEMLQLDHEVTTVKGRCVSDGECARVCH